MFDYLLYNIPSTVCFGIAGYMAYEGKEGWGWFLFVGVLIYGVPKMIR